MDCIYVMAVYTALLQQIAQGRNTYPGDWIVCSYCHISDCNMCQRKYQKLVNRASPQEAELIKRGELILEDFLLTLNEKVFER